MLKEPRPSQIPLFCSRLSTFEALRSKLAALWDEQEENSRHTTMPDGRVTYIGQMMANLPATPFDEQATGLWFECQGVANMILGGGNPLYESR